jgi:hypothetical protein
VTPKFNEMAKVRVRYENGPQEGYVVAMKEQDGRWLYKVSHPDQDDTAETWDNWVPEDWLEKAR